VPRRNLIPFALLGVLTVLTAVFAVFGASSAPSGATLAVQNASGATFGSPAGSTSFVMDLINSLSTGTGTGTLTQVRLIRYDAPDHMALYQVGSKSKLIATLDKASITCSLSAYTAIVGGTTPWTASGNAYTRTESLGTYLSRVPRTAPPACEPRPTSVQGQVLEKAVVRSGYLVSVRLTVVVPAQRLSNGSQVAHGAEGEALVFLQINGTPTRTLAP
jgi:hypothetical protein